MKRTLTLLLPAVALLAVAFLWGIWADRSYANTVEHWEGDEQLPPYRVAVIGLGLPLLVVYAGLAVPFFCKRQDAALIRKAKNRLLVHEAQNGPLDVVTSPLPAASVYRTLDREERLRYWKHWLLEQGEYVPPGETLLRAATGDDAGGGLLRTATNENACPPESLLRPSS
jgi:hypothetical protein